MQVCKKNKINKWVKPSFHHVEIVSIITWGYSGTFFSASWSFQHRGFGAVQLLTWQLRAPHIHVLRQSQVEPLRPLASQPRFYQTPVLEAVPQFPPGLGRGGLDPASPWRNVIIPLSGAGWQRQRLPTLENKAVTIKSQNLLLFFFFKLPLI